MPRTWKCSEQQILLRKSEAKLQSYLTKKFWKWLTRATVVGFSTGTAARPRPIRVPAETRIRGAEGATDDKRTTVRRPPDNPSLPAEGSGKPNRTCCHSNARQNYWETKCDGGSALSRSDKQIWLSIYRSMHRTITEYTSEQSTSVALFILTLCGIRTWESQAAQRPQRARVATGSGGGFHM